MKTEKEIINEIINYENIIKKNLMSPEDEDARDKYYAKINLLKWVLKDSEKDVTNTSKINELICGNTYKVRFKDSETGFEYNIKGELQNFNPCGTVVILSENFELYVFEYSAIKLMIPVKDKKKEVEDMIEDDLIKYLNLEDKRLIMEEKRKNTDNLIRKENYRAGIQKHIPEYYFK